MSPKVYSVVVDNPSVRVLRVTLPPGGKTAMHAHPDTIVIPLTATTVRFTGADGKSEEANMPSESATARPAESHMGENIGKIAASAVVVEFKAAKPGTVAIPTDRADMTLKVLADTPRAVAYRVTADPKFQEPAGTKHEYDQVVIALAPAAMSLSIDGKPAKTKWARGDVQFIARGTPHESKNLGGKPVDFIIVAVK